MENEVSELKKELSHYEKTLGTDTNTNQEELYSRISTMKLDFIMNMLNNYHEYYKQTMGISKNIKFIDGIDNANSSEDLKDKKTKLTNHEMEKFYEEQVKYNEAEKEKSDYNKIYDTNTFEKMVIGDELYCIFEDGVPIMYSSSLFSLLIEITNLKNEHANNYTIISLK